MGDMWARWVPLTGLLAIVLFALAFIIGGDTPDPDASSQEVVEFYLDNEGSQVASALLAFYGSVFLIFFVSVLWRVLRSAPGATGRLASVSLSGGVLMALGILLFAGLALTLADLTEDLEPPAAQAINALSGNLFFPAAAGTVTFLIGSGLAILRGAPLPRWLGWVAIVLGVISATPLGFFAFLAALLWIAVASIVLFTAAPAAPVAGGGTAAQAPPPGT